MPLYCSSSVTPCTGTFAEEPAMSPLFVVRRPHWFLPASLLLLAVFLVGAPPAVAQKDTGAIVGTVHDASGAGVVGAKGSITDLSVVRRSRPRPTHPANTWLALCASGA